MNHTENLCQVNSRRQRGITVFVIVSSLVACNSGGQDYRTIDTIISESTPIILEYAPSALALGPASFRVRKEGDDSGTVLYETTISNDGSDILLDNVKPNAQKAGFLWLCLNGVEQADVSVRIDFSTGLVVEEVRPCRD